MMTEKQQSEIEFLLKTLGKIEEKIRTDSAKRKAKIQPEITLIKAESKTPTDFLSQ
jgi:hypothetical protein